MTISKHCTNSLRTLSLQESRREWRTPKHQRQLTTRLTACKPNSPDVKIIGAGLRAAGRRGVVNQIAIN